MFHEVYQNDHDHEIERKIVRVTKVLGSPHKPTHSNRRDTSDSQVKSSARVCVIAALLLASATPLTAQDFWVWEKTSPCEDTRQDWFAVAQNYPGGGGSPNAWQKAEGPFSIFAAALARADIRKMDPATAGTPAGWNFQRRCCKDWRVIRNTTTGALSVTRGDAPFGFQPVDARPRCCEDAFAFAGIAVGSVRDCRNLQLSAPAVLPTGPVSAGTTITVRPDGTWATFGSMPPVRGSSACNGTFHAPDGSVYRLNVVGETVTGSYTGAGGHSGLTGTIQGKVSGNTISARFSAREGQVSGTGTMTLICGPGTISGSYRSSDGRQSGQFALAPGEPPPVTPAPRPPTPTPRPPGERPCNADERGAFARIAGSWKSYRMDITIGGSCENVNGTYKYASYCESVDATDNRSTERINGTLAGRMQGSSLQVNWHQLPHGSGKFPAVDGAGSCQINGKGELDCGGFVCSTDGSKRQ